MRFREIADARNAVFLNVAPKLACSDYARIVPPLWLEFSLVSGSADFVAGAALCEPPCADFVAGAIQNAFSRDSGRTKFFDFQYKGWLRTWQVKLCGTTCAGRSRVMVGSWSDHGRIMVGIVPPLWLEFSLVS